MIKRIFNLNIIIVLITSLILLPSAPFSYACLESEISKLKENISQLEKQKKELFKNYINAGLALDKAEKEQKNKSSEFTRLMAKKIELENSGDVVFNIILLLLSQCRGFKKFLPDWAPWMPEWVKGLFDKISNLRRKLNIFKKQIKEIEKKVNELGNRLKELKDLIAKLKFEKLKSEGLWKEKEKELEDARDSLEGKQEKLKSLNHQIATTKAEISDLKTRIAKKKAELKKKQEEDESTASIGGDLAYDIDKLKRQLEILETKLVKLEEEHGC